MSEPSTAHPPERHTAPASTGSPPRAPRWVKITAALAAVIVLVVVLMLVVGGEHGPGRHLGGQEAPAGQNDGAQPSGGHVPPPGGH